MRVGRGGRTPWIFIQGTDKIGLMVLFFDLVFSEAPFPWEFFCRRPWVYPFKNADR